MGHWKHRIGVQGRGKIWRCKFRAHLISREWMKGPKKSIN